MSRRPPPPPKPSFWHPTRLGWVNSLGFALSVIYAGWLVLALFRTVMPRSAALEFTIPTVYIAVVMLTLLANVTFCGLVLSHAWRGADYRDPQPRKHVLLWSLSGIAFFLVAALVLLKFGSEPLPNVAPWAAAMFWRGSIIGLPAFALMTYVNSHEGPSPASAPELFDEAYEEA